MSKIRSAGLQKFQSSPFADVLIIGGGINGISTFRELALQGVNVALVEKNDFCSGASAASSHMIHGGIRYLENGEIRLVRESLLERNRLLATAPHFVKPLKTTMPIFSLFSGVLAAPLRLFFHRGGKPQERGALLIKIGLLLYDTFGRNGGTMPRHQFFGRKKTLETLPFMNKNVKFSAHYFDAAIENPERLGLDLVTDTLAIGGHARAINYVEAVSFTEGKVVLRDTVSGETLSFEAPVVINASGPWTDITNKGLGLESSYLGGTKGSHIVLNNPELLEACDGREIFFENSDGRIVLMYPILGRVLLGTTDIPIDDPNEAVCTEEEVDYFFNLASHVFPTIALDRSQIVFRYSGVRPLPAAVIYHREWSHATIELSRIRVREDRRSSASSEANGPPSVRLENTSPMKLSLYSTSRGKSQQSVLPSVGARVSPLQRTIVPSGCNSTKAHSAQSAQINYSPVMGLLPSPLWKILLSSVTSPSPILPPIPWGKLCRWRCESMWLLFPISFSEGPFLVSSERFPVKACRKLGVSSAHSSNGPRLSSHNKFP